MIYPECCCDIKSGHVQLSPTKHSMTKKKSFYVITDIYKCLFSPTSTKCHSN